MLYYLNKYLFLIPFNKYISLLIYFLLLPFILISSLISTIIAIKQMGPFSEGFLIKLEVRENILPDYKNTKYFIIFESKKYNDFYKEQIVKNLLDDIKVIWVNLKKYRDDGYRDNKEINDLLTILNTQIKRFTYPIFLSIRDDIFLHYCIRNLMTRYNKGRITIEEFVHEINNYDNMHDYYRKKWNDDHLMYF